MGVGSRGVSQDYFTEHTDIVDALAQFHQTVRCQYGLQWYSRQMRPNVIFPIPLYSILPYKCMWTMHTNKHEAVIVHFKWRWRSCQISNLYRFWDDFGIVTKALQTLHRTQNKHFSGENTFRFLTISFTSLYHVWVSVTRELKKKFQRSFDHGVSWPTMLA